MLEDGFWVLEDLSIGTKDEIPGEPTRKPATLSDRMTVPSSRPRACPKLSAHAKSRLFLVHQETTGSSPNWHYFGMTAMTCSSVRRLEFTLPGAKRPGTIPTKPTTTLINRHKDMASHGLPHSFSIYPCGNPPALNPGFTDEAVGAGVVISIQKQQERTPAREESATHTEHFIPNWIYLPSDLDAHNQPKSR